jgi:hypothetical protein
MRIMTVYSLLFHVLQWDISPPSDTSEFHTALQLERVCTNCAVCRDSSRIDSVPQLIDCARCACAAASKHSAEQRRIEISERAGVRTSVHRSAAHLTAQLRLTLKHLQAI